MPLYCTSCRSRPVDHREVWSLPDTVSDSTYVLRHLASGPDSGSFHDAVCPLRPTTASSRIARDFTATTLRSWGLATLSEDAVVIVSELVTNAIRHGRPLDISGDPLVRLSLTRHNGLMMCIVADACTKEPSMRVSSNACENGRGLHVVEALSRVWGWTPLPGRGKAVWAGLAIA